MRIRQVRPEFWTDETMAALPDSVRLFYVGLWGISDDGGYLEWRPSRIGALLYPYQPTAKRERHIAAWGDALEAAGRLVRYPDCGCAYIPTLVRHQRVAGNKSFTARDAHLKHGVRTSTDMSVHSRTSTPVEERRVEVSRVEVDAGLIDSWRRQGLPVDNP